MIQKYGLSHNNYYCSSIILTINEEEDEMITKC